MNKYVYLLCFLGLAIAVAVKKDKLSRVLFGVNSEASKARMHFSPGFTIGGSSGNGYKASMEIVEEKDFVLLSYEAFINNHPDIMDSGYTKDVMIAMPATLLKEGDVIRIPHPQVKVFLTVFSQLGSTSIPENGTISFQSVKPGSLNATMDFNDNSGVWKIEGEFLLTENPRRSFTTYR